MAQTWFDRLLGAQPPRIVERPPVLPAAGDGAIPPALAQFNNPIEWMRKAWGLTIGKLPRFMDFSMLRLTTDPFQGGWPFMQLASYNVVTPANGTAGAFLLVGLGGAKSNAGPTLAPVNSVWAGFGSAPSIFAGGVQIPIDPTLTWRVLGFSVTHTGGAAATEVQIVGAPNRTQIFVNGGSNAFPVIGSAAVPNGGGIATMSPLAGATAGRVGFGFVAPIWLPAPYDWQFSFPAAAAAEGYTVSVIMAGLPAGVAAVG